SCLFDIVNVKLEPNLGSGDFLGPGILAKAGLRCLRKRPQSETVCAFQSLGMEIAACLLLEIDTEHLAVELATCDGPRDDRTKARKHLGFSVGARRRKAAVREQRSSVRPDSGRYAK